MFVNEYEFMRRIKEVEVINGVCASRRDCGGDAEEAEKDMLHLYDG